jgi:hemoglobin-like flavoprotein
MTYFYGHLFAIAPGIRGLFPASMHAQRERLYRALCEIAGGADSGAAARDDAVSADAAAAGVAARGDTATGKAVNTDADEGDTALDNTVLDNTGPENMAPDDTAQGGADEGSPDERGAGAAGAGESGADEDGADEDGAVKASEHDRALAALGRAHRKFGVQPEHYTPFRAAMLATGRHFARSEADAARAEAAIAAAFDRAAAVMIDAAQADSKVAPAWWTAEVTRHEAPAPDVAVLTVKPDQPLHYLPGQYVPVQTPRWPRQWRSYCIVNAPRPDGTLTLHVRAVPGGLVSTALVYHTRPGDILLLGAPEGPETT